MDKEQLRKKLSEYDNLNDVLKFLIQKYDLQNVKLGLISKPIIIDGLVKAFDMLKPKMK